MLTLLTDVRTGSLDRARAPETPLNIGSMTKYLLTTLEPHGHLRKFVFVISCAIRILCKVDMKALRVLCVIVVARPKEFDGVAIMIERVKLWEVEVVTNSEIDEYGLVCMESVESILKRV